MAEQTELLHGTLDTLVLKTLAWGPRHGYAIARWIEGMSEEALRIEEGSLYPALYRLTDEGRERLAVETAQWSRFAEAVGRILHQPV